MNFEIFEQLGADLLAPKAIASHANDDSVHLFSMFYSMCSMRLLLECSSWFRENSPELRSTQVMFAFTCLHSVWLASSCFDLGQNSALAIQHKGRLWLATQDVQSSACLNNAQICQTCVAYSCLIIGLNHGCTSRAPTSHKIEDNMANDSALCDSRMRSAPLEFPMLLTRGSDI